MYVFNSTFYPVHAQLYVFNYTSSTVRLQLSYHQQYGSAYVDIGNGVCTIRNGLRAKTGFRKDVWKTAVEDVKKVLKVERCRSVKNQVPMKWYKTK